MVYLSVVFGLEGLIIFHLSRQKKKKRKGNKMAVWEVCQGVLFAQTSKLIVLDNSAAYPVVREIFLVLI